MSRREFQFSEGTSNKFWAIEVAGADQTVHYGRIGTAGQTQTKTFGSEDEAKKAADKLIAEKVKKGYTEVTAGAKSSVGTSAAKSPTKEKQQEKPAETKAAKSKSSEANAKTTTSVQANAEPITPTEATPNLSETAPGSAVTLSVTRKIDLAPEDWLLVTWRKRTPLPRPVPPPRPALDPLAWPTNDYYRRPAAAFFVAALIGMHDEMLAVTRSIPDQHYAKSGWDHTYYHQIQRILFGLANSELVIAETRRLGVPLRTPEFLRGWLATTEYAGLDYARDQILAEGKKETVEELLKVFALVKAPEAAPHMLELKLSSKAPTVARQWLEEQVGNAVVGLIPVAAGRGKLAEAAIEYLRDAKKKGHEKLIRNCLKGVSPDVVAAIAKNVLDHEDKEYAVLEVAKMSARLKAAFAGASKKGKVPEWAAATALPPIAVDRKKLGDEQVVAVLDALTRSVPTAPQPLVAALKDEAETATLDAFAWKLFQLWQSEGCPAKEKWAMGAIGLLGGDASALKLTPLIRKWPGESQHQRAVFGLDCLRGIGTDTALMQLNGIAVKLKFKGLQNKAREAMEAIAAAKGLTPAQLEDRIVPDCDLDERGSRVFDFGPRQFRFVLGPDMKPMLKDADGKVKPDLPKPGAKDDAAKAEEAVNAWKLMKKQIKEVATIQAARLEQAMVTGRRWPAADFETLLVKHPLMTNLARLVLWGGYDAKGKLTATFRVTEDQAYSDAKDSPLSLKGIDAVGIVHPLQLTEEKKSAWGEIFSDYEIVPPFPQLGRPIFSLTPDEIEANEIKRFGGIKIPCATIVFGLEKLGWMRGHAMDNGHCSGHSKFFPSADLSAAVILDEGFPVGWRDGWEDQQIGDVFFAPGQYRVTWDRRSDTKTVPLKDLDPVIASEVLSDLSGQAAKGK